MLEEACIIHPVELPCDDRVIRRAEFLVTLATSSAAFSPRLANFYMKKATEVGDTENLSAGSQIVCSQCSAARFLGPNVAPRLTKKLKNKKNSSLPTPPKLLKNYLAYNCKCCGFTELTPGIEKKKEPNRKRKREQRNIVQTNKSTKTTGKQTPATREKQTNATKGSQAANKTATTKRKGRGKVNSVAKMLQQQETQKKKTQEFNFFDVFKTK